MIGIKYDCNLGNHQSKPVAKRSEVGTKSLLGEHPIRVTLPAEKLMGITLYKREYRSQKSNSAKFPK